MLGVLGLGFLLGLQHALEADHLAAVSSIAARHRRLRDFLAHGVTWGIGHTLTLAAFAGTALALGHTIPDAVGRVLETAVGVMLVALGLHLLWRLWRDRVHVHGHSHGEERVHFHLHSHRAAPVDHARDPHRHEHGFRWRTLAVGLMHGLAGSAALVVLVLAQAENVTAALLYVVVFGLGSTAGMAALSAVIAVPLMASARFLTLGHRLVQAAVGVATLGIGLSTILSSQLA